MRGTKQIRRMIPGFGLLRVASGAQTNDGWKRCNEAIQKLAEAGRLDWIRALVEIDPDTEQRRVTPLQVVDALRTARAQDLPAPGVTDFSPASIDLIVDALVASKTAGEDHEEQLRRHLRTLAKHTSTVQGLPDALRKERTRCQREGKAVLFKRLRVAALTFARETVGRRNPVYFDLLDTDLLKVSRKRPPRLLQVHEALAVVELLGPPCDAIFMTMLLTGAGPKELFVGGLSPLHGHVYINGGKTRTRRRLVPLLELVDGARTWRPDFTRPDMSVLAFEKRLRRVLQGAVTAYDARRTYSKWIAVAKLPTVHQKQYMGHAPQCQTEEYQMAGTPDFHDVLPYIGDDAATLRGWIAGERERAQKEPKPVPDFLPGRAVAETPREPVELAAD